MNNRARAASMALVFVCGVLSACRPTTPEPTRVILFIADGAGVEHWTLAAYAAENLSVGRFRSVGLVDTRGADHTVSGSAPTASAYATGVRTFMGAVSVGPDSLPVRSVVEVALERGLSTGLMTTTALVDATPAAFGAHAVARSEFANIAQQMSTKGITVLMGGGRSAFGPGVQPDSTELFSQIREDYTYVETVDALRSLDADTVTTLMALLATGDMGIVAERGPALQTMTSVALRVLDKNPRGFFLMVENEESDTQAHRNAGVETITAEMLDFSAAIDSALAYQELHPETLVIVTGDHETGGISLTYDDDREIVMQYASGSHTGALLPLFASGPGAERFGGIIRNDVVGQILLDIVGGGGR